MGSYVLGLREIDQRQVAVVGGKGAQLGELSRMEGIRVPAGFCVTTDAFRRIMQDAPSIEDRLNRLSRLNPDDREAIRTRSAEIRRTLEGIVIPDDLAAAITRALAGLGERAAYAVRSSATAEDLPAASFAGQQDTYLNVVGPADARFSYGPGITNNRQPAKVPSSQPLPSNLPTNAIAAALNEKISGGIPRRDNLRSRSSQPW
jgi:rifampicin phosphotransferase